MDLIERQKAIDAVHADYDTILDFKSNGRTIACSVEDIINTLPSVQPEMNLDEWCTDCKEYDHKRHCCPRWNRVIRQTLKDAQPEPLSDAYMKAVWTWLLEYQIKAAELKGRYTPYEVLSWVANDWRKEHEGSD